MTSYDEIQLNDISILPEMTKTGITIFCPLKLVEMLGIVVSLGFLFKIT